MKQFYLISVFVAIMTISIQYLQAQGKRIIEIRAGYQISGLFDSSERVSGTSNLGSFYASVFKENKIIPFLHWGTGLEYCINGAEFGDNSKQKIH